MTQLDSNNAGEITIALPDGGQATVTIKAMSVVVVPVPPQPRQPGELYLLHAATPETNLEVTIRMSRS